MADGFLQGIEIGNALFAPMQRKRQAQAEQEQQRSLLQYKSDLDIQQQQKEAEAQNQRNQELMKQFLPQPSDPNNPNTPQQTKPPTVNPALYINGKNPDLSGYAKALTEQAKLDEENSKWGNILSTLPEDQKTFAQNLPTTSRGGYITDIIRDRNITEKEKNKIAKSSLALPVFNKVLENPKYRLTPEDTKSLIESGTDPIDFLTKALNAGVKGETYDSLVKALNMKPQQLSIAIQQSGLNLSEDQQNGIDGTKRGGTGSSKPQYKVTPDGRVLKIDSKTGAVTATNLKPEDVGLGKPQNQKKYSPFVVPPININR